MIDTVTITTKDFVLLPGHKFRAKVDTSLDTGDILKEGRPFYNASPVYFDEMLEWKTGEKILSLHTSIPKLLFGSSLVEAGEETFPEVVKRLDSSLSSAGVKCASVSSWFLNRVDFCRNIQVEEAYRNYFNTLSAFGMSRRVKTSHRDQTLLWGNTLKQFCIYDKVSESLASAMKERPKDREKIASLRSRPKNILRLETRLLKRKVVETLPGVSGLFDSTSFSRSLSRRMLLEDLDGLTGDPSQESFDFSDWNIRLELAKDRRNSLEVFARGIGYAEILNRFRGDIDQAGEWLISKGFRYHTVRRFKGRLDEEKRVNAGLLTGDPSRLLKEIRSKLVA
jgi:hypothetical protein